MDQATQSAQGLICIVTCGPNQGSPHKTSQAALLKREKLIVVVVVTAANAIVEVLLVAVVNAVVVVLVVPVVVAGARFVGGAAFLRPSCRRPGRHRRLRGCRRGCQRGQRGCRPVNINGVRRKPSKTGLMMPVETGLMMSVALLKIGRNRGC